MILNLMKLTTICIHQMSLTDLQNASRGSKKSCDITVKSLFYITLRELKQNRHKMAAAKMAADGSCVAQCKV